MDFKKTNIRLIGLVFLLLFAISGFSQDQKVELIKTNSARESLKIAQQFINNGSYKKAKRQLIYTLKLKKNFAVAYRELGKVYMELENYNEAIQAYESSFNSDAKISRAAYYECGEAYFKLGQFEEALYYFNEYRDLKNGQYANRKMESGLELAYDEAFILRMENIVYVMEAQSREVKTFPRNLGTSINSKNNEYLPAISNTGKRLVFTRDIKGENENILTSSYDKKGFWSKARKLDNRVNTFRNEGMAKFAADGKLFYFTGCKRKDSAGGCDIYGASLDLFGEVTEVNHLEGLNSNYWDSQPCVSCNGNIIYYASTRPGGMGGSDLYYSTLQKDGTWSEGINIGPKINTKWDEEAPYIASDGKTLYFTSTGLAGQGDGDLFLSRLGEDQNWGEPVNLGYPINSQSKELGMYVHKDGKSIFFASARAEGNGGLDIYQYELPIEFRPESMNNVYGFVTDDKTNKPIETEVKVYREGEKYSFNANQFGQFFTCLKRDKAYTFHVEVDGYKPFMSAVFLESGKDNEPNAVEIRLIPENEKEKVVIDARKYTTIKQPKEVVKRVAFYFDTNSASLNLQTQSKLDDLVSVLSENLSKWSIEVVGFADHTGTAEYNKKLSEKRAFSVAEYLNNSGISINNVRQEGKGAIASNSMQDAGMNRRVEVILKGKIMEEVKLYQVN